MAVPLTTIHITKPERFCENCIYFCREKGECRRNPPIRSSNMNDYTPIWPYVQDKDWCGEFRLDVQSISPVQKFEN
jgi:hypothetical protein